jgi:hypothetical protein
VTGTKLNQNSNDKVTGVQHVGNLGSVAGLNAAVQKMPCPHFYIPKMFCYLAIDVKVNPHFYEKKTRHLMATFGGNKE